MSDQPIKAERFKWLSFLKGKLSSVRFKAFHLFIIIVIVVIALACVGGRVEVFCPGAKITVSFKQ